MRIHRNLLSHNELVEVQKCLSGSHWNFGYISNDPTVAIWNYDKIAGKVAAEIVGSKFKETLDDYHINGQTINQRTAIHNDSSRGATKAVVFFPFKWNFEWGGRLYIFDKNVNIITPEENLAVEFDSSLNHYVDGPTVNQLRISIGLKLK